MMNSYLTNMNAYCILSLNISYLTIGQPHTLSTQRLDSFLIHLCPSCIFGYNLLPIANFLKLTKTYQFM